MTLMRHSDFRRNRSFFYNPASEVRAILFLIFGAGLRQRTRLGRPRMTTAKSSHQDEGVVEARGLTAPQIFDAAAANAREELRRSDRKPAFSGIAGRLTIGLTALGVATVRSMVPNEARHHR